MENNKPVVSYKVQLSKFLIDKARNNTKRVTWLMHHANLTRPTAINLFHGTSTRIEFTTLASVCEALQVTPDQILEPVHPE